jgi:hypothetical protein
MPRYTKKIGGLPCCQTLAHKPAWEISSRPTAGWLVGYRADLQNLRTNHTSLREELTKQLPLKDRKKKTCKFSQPPGETKRELLLKYQQQDWRLKE